MLNIVNLALAITTSFAMATALSFVAYNYWQDSQIEKKLKSSASEFENAKISIEKDHVQAIEALDKFDKELGKSEKQIVEAVNEFNKKRKEKLSEADHKTKKSEPPERIKPDLRAPIQPELKDEDFSSEGSDDNISDYDDCSVSNGNLNPNRKMVNKATLSNNTQRKPYNLDNSNFGASCFENDKADQRAKARNTMNQQKLTFRQRSESLSEDEKSESEKNNSQGCLQMSDSRIFQQSHKDQEPLSQLKSAIYSVKKNKNDDLNEEDLLDLEKLRAGLSLDRDSAKDDVFEGGADLLGSAAYNDNDLDILEEEEEEPETPVLRP